MLAGGAGTGRGPRGGAAGRRRAAADDRAWAGPRQLWRILGELVDAQATGAAPLGEVLRQGYAARASEASGAALVVVTPALDGAWLPGLATWQRGRPGGALALLVAAQAALALPIAARLAASGVASQTFEVGTALPLLNPPKPRTTMRVSPLGKVVRELEHLQPPRSQSRFLDCSPCYPQAEPSIMLASCRAPRYNHADMAAARAYCA